MPPFRLQELHGPGPFWDGPAWLIHWPLAIPADPEAAERWHDQGLAAVERDFPSLAETPPAGTDSQPPDPTAAGLVITMARRMLAPAPVDLKRPRPGLAAADGLRIVTCLQHELVGVALRLAHELIRASWLQPEANNDGRSALAGPLASLQQHRDTCCRHGITMQLLNEARQQGIPQLLIDPKTRLYQLGTGCQARWINSTASDRDSRIGCEISQDKQRTNQLLRSLGLPVPRQLSLPISCSDSDLAQAAARIGYPCVLKPADCDQGRGVVVGIESEEQLLQAATESRRQAKGKLVVEAWIPGSDIRLAMLNGSLAWAVERVPPSITGDGMRTVSELIAAANRQRAELRARDGISGQIPMDDETLHHLQQAGLTLSSVPPAADVIRLRNNANVSTGGLFHFITDQVHPEVRRQCETIVATLRLSAAGIDYISSDIRQPPDQCPGAFIEVNWMPQASAKQADIILRELFPAGSPHSMATLVVIAGFEAEALATLRQKLTRLLATDSSPTLAFPRRLGDKIAALQLGASCRQRAYEHPREILLDASQRSAIFLVDNLQVLQNGLPLARPDRILFWSENPLKSPEPWQKFEQRMQLLNQEQKAQSRDS